MNQKHSADTEIIWKDTRLDEIGRIVAGGTPSTSNPDNWNGPVAWVTPADLSGLRSRHLTTTERTLTELGLATSAAHLLPPRSLVISSRAPIGHMALPLVSFCTNQGCKTIAFFDGQDPDFHYYNLRFWVRRLHDKGEGTTFSEISKKALEAVEVPVPSNCKVQETIAGILALLDRAIEQTEALLAKQQRIKTGLMHDLLTRGLDAQGRLRDPSIHQFKNTVLGPTPTDWDETNIGALATLVTSGPRGWARYYSSAGAKFIRIGNLTREHVNLRLEDMQFVSPPDGAEGNRTELIPGDVLFSITADLGIVGLIPDDFGPAYINQHIALIRPKTGDIVSGWLANFLASHRIQRWISNSNESGAKAGLNLPTIKSVPVTAPKPPEQRMIADILGLCDRQIAETRAYIVKLRRQKAGLMHDLLTGHVPVTPLLANSKAPNSS